MQAVLLLQAQQHLPELIERDVDDAEPLDACLDAGQHVVSVSLEDYNAWKETAYLLSNPVNAARLRKSLAEAQSGFAKEGSSWT